MWRSFHPRPLLRALAAAAVAAERRTASVSLPPARGLSTPAAPPNTREAVTAAEARRLMRLVDVETLKRRLAAGGAEVVAYNELLAECGGLARSREEAVALARALDEAGVVLLFRDKAYIHPDKVVDLIRRAVPLALTPDDDPRREELKQLLKKKEEIDRLAHKQVRQILWSGLGFLIVQIGLFFRLTFWELSWDVMEPIAFFTTATGLLVGYSYFLITSRDPTYQDFMERLFTSRQRKLSQKLNFDMERFMELQTRCKFPFDRHMRGIGLQELHRN